MDMQKAQAGFLSLLDRIKKGADAVTEGRERFPVYIQWALVSDATMRRYWHYQLSHTRYVRSLIEGRTLLDAGCGSASLSILLSLLGARNVYAVDSALEQIEQARFAVRMAGVDNINIVQADVSSLNMPPQSLDGIFSIEAFSHYRSSDIFLEQAARLIKPGGFLVIADGNNAASPKLRAKLRKIWDTFEHEMEPRNMYGHTKGPNCYLSLRKDIIHQGFPELDEQTVNRYARWTYAFSKESTVAAVRQFLKGDYSLRSEYRPDRCPLDPVTDCYMEQWVDPKVLVRELDRLGFRASAKSCGPVDPRLAPVRWIWEVLSALTIYSSRPLHVVAHKVV